MGKIEFSIDKDKNLTVVVFLGNISTDELISTQNKFYAESPTLYALTDFTEAHLDDFSLENLRKVLDIAKRNADCRRGGKTACVFSDSFGFAMGSMYEIKAEIEKMPFQVRVFKSKDDALKWLSAIN